MNPEHQTPRSRRAFLARLAASIAAPTVLASCGGREETGDPPVAPIEAAGGAAGDPPGLPLPASEPVVRVRLLSRGHASPPTRLGADEWIELRRPVLAEPDPAEPDLAEQVSDERASADAPPVVLRGPIEVRSTARGWSLLDDRGFRPKVRGLETLELRRAEPARPGSDALAVGDDRYPGFVRLVAPPRSKRGRYDVVNHVPVEAYLPRVLEGELYSHWHPETFAAQAVAARSFACAEHAYRGRSHFDVTNTARSQVYAGTTARARAREAATRTRGLVLAHGGKLVPGYYSSCCGGVAADAVDAISDHALNVVPPLRGRPGPDVCNDAKLFAWSITRPRGDVAARLAAFGARTKNERLAAVADLVAIEVAGRNPHGRPRMFRVIAGDGARIELDAESLRRAVDAAANGLPSPRPRLWSSNLSARVEGETVRFDGAGHGHGVGLCQYGAEWLARAGTPYDAILRWYYPHVELAGAYA